MASFRASLRAFLEVFYPDTGDSGSGVKITSDTGELIFGEGTDSDEADLVWNDERTLAASGSEDIDLVGTLVNAYGGTFNPARIVALQIRNKSTQATITVTPKATTGWLGMLAASGDLLNLPRGCHFQWGGPVGASVAAGTDILTVANTNATYSATYQITVLARSA